MGDVSQIDSEEFSEDFSHDVPIESTSHATFIAPALPPIRFSLGGADFSDLLRTVAGQESSKTLDQIIEGMEHELRVDVTPPPAGSTQATPTIDGPRRNHSIDATPVRRQPNGYDADEDLTVRREPVLRSRTPSPSPRPMTEFRKQSVDATAEMMARTGLVHPPSDAAERARSFSDTSNFRSIYGRARGDSNASIVPTGITVTSPENATSKVLRPDTSDLVRNRLQEALADAKGRCATHVKLDADFVAAIVMLLERNKEDYNEIKRKLDGIKVSTYRQAVQFAKY